MQSIPNIQPVSNLRNNYTAVVEELDKGPIVFTQRSKPYAVLISTQEWDKMAEELTRLRHVVAMDAALRRMEQGDYVTEEEYERGLRERGLV